jgi:alpha-glucosidase (family GH31 glycosyl hydrolase)
MMEALGIPNAIYWVDRPWGPGGFGYDDLKWDESRLPNPGRMIGWLKSKGTGFMLWIAPWAVGDMADEAVARGFTVKDETPFMPPAQAKLIDLTNEEAVAWWQGRLIERIGDGVAGFKLDRGDEKVPDGILATGRYHNGMDYREGRNLYPVLYARAVADAFRKAGVGEFMAMPRAAWAGSSAHAVPWGGDAAPSQEGLRMSIIAVQRAAAMNFPVWGSDTCGYDSVYDTACDREVCMRWLAFSAFTPLMEVGPTFDAAPWSRPPEGTKDNIVDEGGYHYAPVYDEDLIAAWIFYARLHHDLRRYTRSLAEAASAHGTPIVRPMALAYPARPEYRDIFDQYLYGPDILVAPIWRKGVGSRDVSLPDGVWIDAWTGKEAVGGTVAAVDTPLPKIPIFLRKGAGVSLGDLDSRLSEAAARAKNRPNLDDLQKDVN